MLSLAKEYNHHVISIKFLDYSEDVYDISVDKYHNFLLDCGVFVHNSVEGFEPAASRYTEAKLSKIAEEMLADINKDTVDFIPNFDGTLKEPVILPSKLPNLLVNGSTGIAVGMATNIPPHNVGEIIDAVVLMIDNKDASMDEILNLVKGPDFPTAGLIIGKAGISQAYQTGKGKLVIRAKTHFEKNSIIVTEIPYQINKTMLIESLADLVNNKTIDGISDIRDDSDKKGMRVVIELKNNSQPEVVLNQMYKHTNLQSTFGVIMLALVDNEPRILNLKELIQNYILHRKDVVTRRTRFDLKKAEERLHIVLGLNIALSNIDHVVRLIKESKSAEAARATLMMRYSLSEIQAQAILDMRLQRLTSLEREKLRDEQLSLDKLIIELKEILASELRIFGMIKQELIELKNKYNDKRRTEIIDGEEDIETEDLIKEEDVVVTITHQGYIKQQQLEQYRQQKRGGHGIIATETKDDDFAEQLFITNNHNYLLFFTNKGKIYWLKAYRLPASSRYSKGKAIVNLLNLEKDEKISTTLPVSHFDDKHFLIMATKKGMIKKTSLIEYSNPRKTGIAAINLREGDELIKVRLTPGTLKMLLGTKKGMAVKFDEKDVRAMGRKATGVRGIRLGKGDEVIGLEVARGDATLLTITENGYGKRTAMEEYRLIRRGGKGVINIQTTERNGNVVGIKTVMDPDEVMIITKRGITIRLVANGVSVIGRNTQGVRVIKLKEPDKVASLARVNTNTNQIIKNSQ